MWETLQMDRPTTGVDPIWFCLENLWVTLVNRLKIGNS